MIDKEKIKAIIKQYADKGEKLYNESCETKEDSQIIDYWDGYRDCANLLLRELGDVQEEPKECMYSKDNYTDEDRKVLCDGCEEECRFNKKEYSVSEIDFEQELYKYFGQVKDFTLGMRIAKRFYEIGRNYQESTSDEQVKELTKTQHIKETCKENGDSLTQEPMSEGLEEAGKEWLKPQLDKSYANYGEAKMMELTHFDGYAMLDAIEFGANWQKANLWKPADGDDLPEIDREVIALLDNSKVVFAHRPPEYWDGKDVVTGKVTRHYPKTYDKGGWNIPNVKYWLDVELSKEIEL